MKTLDIVIVITVILLIIGFFTGFIFLIKKLVTTKNSIKTSSVKKQNQTLDKIIDNVLDESMSYIDTNEKKVENDKKEIIKNISPIVTVDEISRLYDISNVYGLNIKNVSDTEFIVEGKKVKVDYDKTDNLFVPGPPVVTEEQEQIDFPVQTNTPLVAAPVQTVRITPVRTNTPLVDFPFNTNANAPVQTVRITPVQTNANANANLNDLSKQIRENNTSTQSVHDSVVFNSIKKDKADVKTSNVHDKNYVIQQYRNSIPHGSRKRFDDILKLDTVSRYFDVVADERNKDSLNDLKDAFLKESDTFLPVEICNTGVETKIWSTLAHIDKTGHGNVISKQDIKDSIYHEAGNITANENITTEQKQAEFKTFIDKLKTDNPTAVADIVSTAKIAEEFIE